MMEGNRKKPEPCHLPGDLRRMNCEETRSLMSTSLATSIPTPSALMDSSIEDQYAHLLEVLRLRRDAGVVTVTQRLDYLVGCLLIAKGSANTSLQTGAHTVVTKVFSEEERQSFFMLSKVCLLRITKQDRISEQELSALFVRSGFEKLSEALGELIVRSPDLTENTIGDGYRLRHTLLEVYLAAVHLATSPVMAVIDFITETLPLAQEAWLVLKILSGLCCGNMWSDHGKSMLPQIMNCVFTTQLPLNEPVVLLPQFFHILECLKESEDSKLYRMLLQEYLMARTIVLSPTDLKVWMTSIAAFVVHSLPSNEHWTCFVRRGKSVTLVNKLCRENQGFVVARDIAELNIGLDRDLIVLTTRKVDYLHYTLAPFIHKALSQRAQDVPHGKTFASPQLLPESTCTPTGPQSPTQQSFAPYGYLTETQYESKKKLRNTSHFNLVKDLVVPHIQKHSTELVKAQYRKSDHLWMSVSSNVRNDWYEAVKTAPNVPIHWVKVRQPDGFEESEKKFKSKAELETLRHRSAELVILNSQYMNLVEIVPPSSNVPVTIPLQAQSEHQDQGMIGCDFLRKEHEVENVSWFDSRPFDIKSDQRIGRLLPLPPKKVELGVTTTLSNISKEGDSVAQGQPQVPLSGKGTRNETSPTAASISSLASFIPRLTKPYLEATADLEAIAVSEHQIKKEAMNGFDRPGYCFYGDNRVFQVSYVYALPDSLSTCRMLREGGNGVVLEVKFSGEAYAVKKTAFRWREVLIMPKLRHKNVLKLVAMMVGPPMENQPKRKYVYHFYPKMSNDLGRSVGSFEKHCLRTLCERYSGEPLLLRKIKSNFRYVGHEILTALEYLHSLPHPIVHRDVKVSNILVRMTCDCRNPLICVCRRRPEIVLSDFDASLELQRDGTLEADPPRSSAFGFQTTSSKVYHVSAVGTTGYKSPEGSMYCTGNSLDVMPPLSTKADIFSFGVLMSLLLLNLEGPKSQLQMAKMLLSINQTVAPGKSLNMEQRRVLGNHDIKQCRPAEIAVGERDVERVLPIGRARKELNGSPEIVSFLERSLQPDPSLRANASSLLQHPYLKDF